LDSLAEKLVTIENSNKTNKNLRELFYKMAAINEYIVELARNVKQELSNIDKYTVRKIATGGLIGLAVAYGM
jgi:predicted transcriptional regulator with HTH domain